MEEFMLVVNCTINNKQMTEIEKAQQYRPEGH